ncbi:MAG: hypothetical protein EXX96DRAFT_619500 [Benjaminiella poitrasii]|nr:MAG: hypothetical protein EXX96DRAFT_619500 [Benjaminiella poitrasii]
MAHSNFQPIPNRAENQTPPNTRKSYVNAVKGTNKVSLLNTANTAETNKDTNSSTLLQSRIYRTSRVAGTWLFDVSKCRSKHTDQQIVQQHPTGHSFSFISNGSERYIEYYIDED